MGKLIKCSLLNSNTSRPSWKLKSFDILVNLDQSWSEFTKSKKENFKGSKIKLIRWLAVWFLKWPLRTSSASTSKWPASKWISNLKKIDLKESYGCFSALNYSACSKLITHNQELRFQKKISAIVSISSLCGMNHRITNLEQNRLKMRNTRTTPWQRWRSCLQSPRYWMLKNL